MVATPQDVIIVNVDDFCYEEIANALNEANQYLAYSQERFADLIEGNEDLIYTMSEFNMSACYLLFVLVMFEIIRFVKGMFKKFTKEEI